METFLLEAHSLIRMTDGAVSLGDNHREAGSVLVAGDAGLREMWIAATVAAVEIRSAMANLTEASSGSRGVGEPTGRRAVSVVELDLAQAPPCTDRWPQQAQVL